MFDPTSWSRLGGLMFTAKTLVDGLYAGGHASPRHGAGMEFHDYRPYVPGDDLSAVDWKLFGRTDRYYLRRDRRYSDLHVQLLVDVSASMRFASLAGPGEDRPTKLTVATQLAAAIAFLTIRQGDRVGLALGVDRLRAELAVQGGWPHLQRVCAMLEKVEAGEVGDGPGDDPDLRGASVRRGGWGRLSRKGAVGDERVGGDMGACLRQVQAMRRRRGLLVMVSDLLDEPGPVLDAVRRLRHDRFEVIVLQVLSPDELSLSRAGRSGGGWRRLVDAESSRWAAVRLGGVGPAYDRRLAAHVAGLRSGCLGCGAGYELVRTDRPVLASLRQYLADRRAAGV